MISRSNSAMKPKIVSIIFPVGLTVSKFIFKMRRPTSLVFSVSITLGDDFRDVRAAVFGASERRTLADFRRSGAMEAAAGGADAATISAKMANTLSASNALHRAYMPVEITKVRAADVARLAGRRKMRENEK